MKKKALKKTLNKVSESYSRDFCELSTRLSQEKEYNKELLEAMFEQEKRVLETLEFAADARKDIDKLLEGGIKIEVSGDHERVKQLEAQILDEQEVGIRARRIYKALQSNPETHPVSLEQKAKNLYVYTERMTDRTLTEASLERGIDLETQLSEEFDALPVDQKEEMMEIFLSISGVKFNS